MSSSSSVSRKLAVVGARAVGKSSLTHQFTDGVFDTNYYPTIENQYLKSFKMNGKVFEVDISDTAGQDEYSIVNERQLIGVHGFLLVYSIASRNSFEVLPTIRDKILNFLSFGEESKVPFIVVGNKTDLSSMRQVEEQEGKDLAKEFNCPFIEVSAKDNLNVDKAFELLLIHIEELTNPQQKKEGGCIIC